jgi:rhamnulokinase
MQARYYLAADLGASNGRIIAAALENDRISLSEMHRFGNGPLQLQDGLHWDVMHLWTEIKKGIAISAAKYQTIESIGLDTWGVDFALLGRHNTLLFPPYHYRDGRTDGILEKAFQRLPRAEIFARTGIQFLQFNTLYQMLALALQKSPHLAEAESFVTLPDLFNYWLSGEVVNEFTNATTTQCLDPLTRDWAADILAAMDIPARIFGQIVPPGTVLGNLVDPLASETGISRIPIIAPACHDTGSAVAAVPAQNQDFAWISSGTWSILGAEVREPCMTAKALAYNFTNEGGVLGTWRLSQNITGLWLLQECRRVWAQQGETLSYDQLAEMASQARPFLAVINPDDRRFLPPGDIAARIREFCADTGQAIPETKGEVIRVALESLALKYRSVLTRLEEITSQRFSPIHIIGGGAKNRLLNQFTANAANRQVIAGPYEATATGNVIMQAIGLKHLGSLAEAREIVRRSFEPDIYGPQNTDRWDEAYDSFKKLMA